MQSPGYHLNGLGHVKHRTEVRIALWMMATFALLPGCATRPAPDFKGRWQAVNRYAATTEEIPLYQSYVFYPAPMDATLKGMLTRWARDSKLSLSYLHPSDFTLHAPIARIRTVNLQDAVSQLNQAYAAQRVSITASGNQIVVRPAADASTGP